MMKKFAALLLAMLLALGCAAALAEAYEEPILFRGIPWGSSYAEIAQEVELDDLYAQKGYGVADRLWKGDSLDYDVGTEGYASYTTFPKVAGYQASYVVLDFAMVPDEDGHLPMDEYGEVVPDPERTRLYAGIYFIYASDEYAAFEDLSNKLTSLYGDADMTMDGISVWYGAEGTMVSVGKRSSSSGNIMIAYACADGDEWLADAQAALDRAFSEDTEGL